jgi:hypothetical protein
MISTTNILEMDGSCSFGVYLTWLSHVGNGRSRRSKHVSGGSSFKALMREAGTRSIWHQDMLRLLRFNMIQHPMNYIILNHTTFFFFMFLCFVSCQGFCSSSFSAPKFEPWSNWGETKGIERVRCTAGPAGVHEPV